MKVFAPFSSAMSRATVQFAMVRRSGDGGGFGSWLTSYASLSWAELSDGLGSVQTPGGANERTTALTDTGPDRAPQPEVVNDRLPRREAPDAGPVASPWVAGAHRPPPTPLR